MAYDHEVIQLALRTRAATLSVATTGSTTLAATTTGYSRSAGSFVTDGFVRGMEITPSGFVTNTVDTITAVAALTITTRNARTAEAAAGSRTLSVGLPSLRAWENVPLTRTQGQPYVEEQYIPGPAARQVTIGPLGEIEIRPMYQLQIHVPEGTGISANGKYASALERLFPPRTAIVLSNGDTLRVPGWLGPMRGQRQPSEPGWNVVPVTIPLWLRTPNTI